MLYTALALSVLALLTSLHTAIPISGQCRNASTFSHDSAAVLVHRMATTKKFIHDGLSNSAYTTSLSEAMIVNFIKLIIMDPFRGARPGLAH